MVPAPHHLHLHVAIWDMTSVYAPPLTLLRFDVIPSVESETLVNNVTQRGNFFSLMFLPPCFVPPGNKQENLFQRHSPAFWQTDGLNTCDVKKKETQQTAQLIWKHQSQC